MININRIKLARAAGFFNGEGWTTVYNKTGSIRLGIRNTHKEELEEFNRAVGYLANISSEGYREYTTKPSWLLSTQSFEKVQAIMCMLWPELSEEKQDQYIKCREIWKSKNHIIGRPKLNKAYPFYR